MILPMTSVLSDEIEKLVFEHASVALVLTERRFILSCNIAFCELFGYKKRGVVRGADFETLPFRC